MRAFIILTLGLAVAIASTLAARIVGGSVTSIDQYPYAVALLLSSTGTGTFSQACGGSIVNNRSIITAAHCVERFTSSSQWRPRVGSTASNSGGVVHTSSRIVRHGSYSSSTLDNDIAIIQITGSFYFNNNVRAIAIASTYYNLPDNANVWIAGWGATRFQGPTSVQLRHAQVQVVNQNTCRTRYSEIGWPVTDNMVCAGLLDVGGRDACQGDSGGPLVYNNVLVGITSWGYQCALARYPGVYARVSRYTSWIQNNT